GAPVRPDREPRSLDARGRHLGVRVAAPPARSDRRRPHPPRSARCGGLAPRAVARSPGLPGRAPRRDALRGAVRHSRRRGYSALHARARRRLRAPMSAPIRSLLLAAASGLCLAEIWIAGLYYHGYQVLAGRHGWFPNEMAFLLYYLLFGIPAITLLTSAIAGSAGRRLLDAFDAANDLPTRDITALVICASALTFLLVTVVRF